MKKLPDLPPVGEREYASEHRRQAAVSCSKTVRARHQAMFAELRNGVELDIVAARHDISPRYLYDLAVKEGIIDPKPRYIPNRGWTDDRVEELKRLWDLGLSCSQIAARIGGISRNAVIGKAARLGLRSRTTISRKPYARSGRPVIRRRREGRFLAKPMSIFERIMMMPLPPDEPTSNTNVHLLDRRDDQCCWVVGPVSSQMMCGAPAVPGLKPAWCLRHSKIGFQPPQPKRRPAPVEAPVPSAPEKVGA